MSLDEILERPDQRGLIDPVDLAPEEASGKLFVPICMLGLFNPMGPTLVALNLVVADGKPSGALLCTTLNPFSQSRVLTARTGITPEALDQALPDAFRCGDELILGSAPTMILLADGIADSVDALNRMLFGLMNYVTLEKPLSEINRDYRENMGNPWERIPSMEEIMQRIESGQKPEQRCGGITDAEFNDWLGIMMTADHAVAEFGAIMQGWQGSISQGAPGLPHMPLAEAAAELTALGFPYFKSAE